jgi:hypothetical protein
MKPYTLRLVSQGFLQREHEGVYRRVQLEVEVGQKARHGCHVCHLSHRQSHARSGAVGERQKLFHLQSVLSIQCPVEGGHVWGNVAKRHHHFTCVVYVGASYAMSFMGAFTPLAQHVCVCACVDMDVCG